MYVIEYLYSAPSR